jgi:hypothetical protein
VTLNIGLRYTLTGDGRERWPHLTRRLMDLRLAKQPDVFVWKLTTSGSFSFKSLYLDHMNDHARFLRKSIYEIKVPVKIRNFYVVFACIAK